METVFIVYNVSAQAMLDAWGSYEEAEAAIVRDIKRGCWYGGYELEDITERDIEQALQEYQIIEVPFEKDDDRLHTELVIDGVPLAN